MRTIIAGSRACSNMCELQAALRNCGWLPTVVLSGTAQGADKLGEVWALRHAVPIERYPADWATHGKRAGYLRNAQMASVAEALIALWDGSSRGTKHMIDIARREGLKVHIHHTGGESMV